MAILGVLYFFLCIVIGFLGNKTTIGFWMCFIIAIFFTPIAPLIYILIVQSGSSKNKTLNK